MGVNSETRGALERAGDVDYFRVAVPAAGTLTVGYFGGAVGSWLSVNDDQERDLNFRIVRQVTARTYVVAVGGGHTATGPYTLRVSLAVE